MSIFEIIGGVLLIFFGLAVVVSVTLQEHKTNLGGALGGSMNEGTYDRGRTKTMDAQLSMISKFDWPFTPTLGSSRSFSTLIGADLHPVLPGLHPGQV